MKYTVQNIIDNIPVEVFFDESINLLTLVNTSPAGLPVNVNLYLQNRINLAEIHYILLNTQIPAGTSLELGSTEMQYLNVVNKLFIQSFSLTGDINVMIH
jgi:hypothetical protein